MKIRRFFGKDMRDALKQVKDELGGDAVIMSNKKVADGIELVVAVDKETEKTQPKPSLNFPSTNGKTPSLSEIIGDDGPDSLRALLEKQNKGLPIDEPVQQQAERSVLADAFKSAGYEEKRKADAQLTQNYARTAAESDAMSDFSVSEDNDDLFQQADAPSASAEDMNSIKAELASIRNVLQFQVSNLADERKKRQNPMHHFIGNRLSGMGVSPSLSEQLVGFLPQHLNEQQGWDYTLNLLANRLSIGGNEILQQSGVVALVGPTGTGKTTTVAKLAAKYAQKYGPDAVAMVTIDTYRIAAYEQLATYGKIIGCAAQSAQNGEELNHCLYQLRHKKLVLIDTAGFSQRDARLVSQLSEYEKDVSVNIRKYAVLPAGAQYQVLKQTIGAYKHSHLSGCILSKLDECYSLGEALSVIIEHDLSVCYVTDGQRVPEDIKLADAKNLTRVAAKLYKKYGMSHTTGQEPVSSVNAL